MKTANYESILRELMPNPLKERRDYIVDGRDTLEQNAISLLEKGVKIPINLEVRLRKKYKKI